MAELSYEMIRKIRSVADRYATLERGRQAEVVKSRRAEASAGAGARTGDRRGPAPHSG